MHWLREWMLLAWHMVRMRAAASGCARCVDRQRGRSLAQRAIVQLTERTRFIASPRRRHATGAGAWREAHAQIRQMR
jgi:hypothetical protein